MRRRHLLPMTIGAAALVAGCSGSDPAATTVSAPVPTAAPAAAPGSAPGSAPAQQADEPTDDGPADAVTAAVASVTASVRSGNLDAELTVEIDGGELGDPFGRFGSCSGLRTLVGAYSVLVADPAGIVRSISLITNDAVDGPGIYDAAVRIEPLAGEVLVATGTMTLDAGLASGSYLAFDAAGVEVAGEFSCPGTSGPEALAVGPDDGILDTVEVFALLRRGDAERVLGLAVATGNGASAECSGAVGVDAPVIVRVDGDQSVGAITTFELTAPPAATMRLRAGSVVYEFDDADVLLDADAVSGTFSAVGPDGLEVDGAFRCT